MWAPPLALGISLFVGPEPPFFVLPRRRVLSDFYDARVMVWGYGADDLQFGDRIVNFMSARSGHCSVRFVCGCGGAVCTVCQNMVSSYIPCFVQRSK